MSTKGTTLTPETKYKISIAKQKNRRDILVKLKEYVGLLVDSKEAFLIPSIVSASLFAGISKKALLTWELTTAEDSEVRQLLEFIRDVEEKYLRDNGLKGIIDSKLTSKFLEAEHGVRSAPQQLTQNNNFNISPELLADAIELSRTKKLPTKGS